MAHIGLGGYTAHIRGYYRLLAHPTSFLGHWHPIDSIRWGEAMRLRPPQPDSPPGSGSSRNWAINPLYALPHPSRSAHSMSLPAELSCELVVEDKGMGVVFQFDGHITAISSTGWLVLIKICDMHETRFGYDLDQRLLWPLGHLKWL